jgi:hypothetical protein
MPAESTVTDPGGLREIRGRKGHSLAGFLIWFSAQPCVFCETSTDYQQYLSKRSGPASLSYIFHFISYTNITDDSP